MCDRSASNQHRAHRLAGMALRLGRYGVAIGHVSSLKRPCFAPRLGRFRNATGHVWQRKGGSRVSSIHHHEVKSLNISLLQKHSENSVFAPNLSVVRNKRVVFYVVCHNNLTQIGHWISILVSVCFEQVATLAPKAMAGYGETRREAKCRKKR